MLTAELGDKQTKDKFIHRKTIVRTNVLVVSMCVLSRPVIQQSNVVEYAISRFRFIFLFRFIANSHI